MVQINTLPRITWRHTNTNSRNYDLSFFTKKEYISKNTEKIPQEFEESFINQKYGLSKEVVQNNKELRNSEEYFEVLDELNIKREYVLDSKNDTLIDIKSIYARENSKSTFIFDYKSKEDFENFKNSVLQIRAEKNSYVKIVLIQRLSNLSKSLMSIVSDIHKDARVDLVHIELGSEKSYFNHSLILSGERAHIDIKTAYFVDGNRELDLAYEMTHIEKETVSDLVVNGVLKDFAKKRFAGTLDFLKGCTHSEGNEEEFVTLLDPTVSSIAVPLLLAREHDIVGNHAASAGKIDKDMLFYIKSRGLDELAAKRIIIESKIKPVFDLIGDENLSKELLEELRNGIERK